MQFLESGPSVLIFENEDQYRGILFEFLFFCFNTESYFTRVYFENESTKFA